MWIEEDNKIAANINLSEINLDNEIKDRLEFDSIFSVSTIHSFAWELKNNIGADSTTPNIKTTTIKVLDSNYVLTRTIDLDTNGNKNMNSLDIDPDILPISYAFAAEGSSQSEYNLTVQIIPNASLKCST